METRTGLRAAGGLALALTVAGAALGVSAQAATGSHKAMAARKATLIGEFGRTTDTGAGRAGALVIDALYNVDIRDLDRYADHVGAVSADQARAAAAKLIDPAQADVVIVGDARLFLDDVKKRFGDKVEVIPAGRFDLDAANLIAP